MTRKQLIEFCVEDQIKRGIISPKFKKLQIDARLNGKFGIKKMNKESCLIWYNAIVNRSV